MKNMSHHPFASTTVLGWAEFIKLAANFFANVMHVKFAV